MKKVFSLILAFFALVSYAEEKTAKFDFTKPATLNPPIETEDVPGYIVVLTKLTANSGEITIAFDKGKGGNTPEISVGAEAASYNRYACLHQGNKFTVTCSPTQKLTKIALKGQSFGSMELYSGSGTYDGMSNIWTADGTTTSSVSLYNNAKSSTDLDSIIVTYEDVRETIAPTTISPEDNAELSAFEKLELTFDGETIESANASSITLTPQVSGASFSASYTGNKVTLSVSPAVAYSSSEQEYTMIIPSGSIKMTDGKYNSNVIYKFKLVKMLSTFKIAEGGLDPDTASTTINAYPTDIKITMADNVGHVNDASITIKNRAGAEVGYCKLSTVDTDAKNIVHLKVTESGAALSNNDIYSLTIPEGYIYDWKYTSNPGSSTCNAAIKLTYNVGNIAVPTAAKLAEAKAVLDMKDKLGYPTATAMTTLQGYYDNKNVHDSDIDTEIANVKASTDIVKPATGKSYTIANVAKDGTKRYLAYNSTEKKIVSTTTASSAYKFVCAGDSFKVTDGDKTYYLTVLSDVDSYTLVKSTSFTEDKSEAAKLTIAHFSHSAVSGMTADNAWGKFSISGPLGEYSGTPYYAASTLNTHTGVACVYSPSTTTTVTLAYDGDRSSLFEITEVEPAAPEVTVTTTPADGVSVSKLNQVTLTFAGNGVTAVNKATDCLSKITLKDSSNKEVSITSVEKDASSDLIYNVNFATVPDGTYTLTVGDGAFTHQFNGKTVNISGFTRTYTVADISKYNYTFNNGKVYSNIPIIQSCKADSVNGFKIWVGFRIKFRDGRTADVDTKPTYTEEEMEFYQIESVTPVPVYLDPANVVYVENSVHRPVITGSLEKELDGDGNYTGYIKMVWSSKVTSSMLKNADYLIDIPAASYGDLNFYNYITAGQGVKSDCYVNSQWNIGFTVNNTATGIQDVDVDADADLKDGKFMENGKIVIYKGGKRYSLSGMLLK